MTDAQRTNSGPEESLHKRRHRERMKDPAYREGYEEASRELEGGTESLDCGCVQAVSSGRVIFGPVDCKEHGDE